MATVKKGILSRAGEWWKHLRHTKKDFWHSERQAAKREIREQQADASPPPRDWRDRVKTGDILFMASGKEREVLKASYHNGRLSSVTLACLRSWNGKETTVYTRSDLKTIAHGVCRRKEHHETRPV